MAPTTQRSASTTDPVPKSLNELCTILHHELRDAGIDEMSDVDVARIKRIMESYVSNERDWEEYALFDSCKYTRNLVDDGNGKFNLIVLCWGEGQQSPVHDHSQAHCLMKVLSGNLVETRYAWPEVETDTFEEKPLKCTAVNSAERDNVVYIHDSIGLHRVSNPSPTKKAISLHLYCPPIPSCYTFDEQTGAKRASGTCTFYSHRGKRVQFGCLGGVVNNKVEGPDFETERVKPCNAFQDTMTAFAPACEGQVQ